ncbi:hypothetical protein ABTE24_20120, partial [Acinetobacter baumannii]
PPAARNAVLIVRSCPDHSSITPLVPLPDPVAETAKLPVALPITSGALLAMVSIWIEPPL